MKQLDRRAFLKVGAVAASGLHLAPSAARAQGVEFKLKLGNDLPATHPVNARLREAIQGITAETGGRVEINLFPNNQLGSDPDMMSQLRYGALELATMPGTVLSTLVRPTSLTGLGFVFTSYDKVWAAMDGDVGDYIRASIEKANIHPFRTVMDSGFRQITTSTRPIQAPEDLRNFKIRVPLVPLWVSMFAALGASPVSIPLSDAYSALQTKIADGQENPLSLINSAKFYEVQKYCSLTNHAWDGFWLLASGRIWGKVPTDLQETIAKHFHVAALKERDDLVQANLDLQKTLEAKGLTFNQVDTSGFQKALRAAGFYKQWRDKFGAEAWGHLQKYVGDIA